VVCAETKEGVRTWLGIMGKKNIQDKTNIWIETQLRHNESNQTMQQTLNRFGLLQTVNEHHELGLLMGYIQSDSLKEYRPTLQYSYKNTWESHSITNRNRLEFRDIENNDADSIRLRVLIRYAYPLSPRYDFVFWEEPFLNLTHEDWTGDRFFERNRAFIGTRIKFEKLSFEVGYMNQSVPRKGTDVSEHIITLYCFF
jgi:hypothetical protein